MKTETVKIGNVKSNPNNPRVIKDSNFEKLVRSIKEFPKMLKIRPIVVNDDMIVLGGNMRLKACKEAGLKEVPIIKASELTEDEQRQFIIKDNVSGGEWDWDMLTSDWDTEKLEEWGLEVPDGLSVEELEAEEDDYEMPEEVHTDIVLGDLFEIGEHRLLCGDSTDSDAVAKLMNGEKADMVFTDPPYAIYGSSTGVGDDIADTKMIQPFFRQLFYNMHLYLDGHFYVCCDWRTYPLLNDLLSQAYFKVKNMIVWDKVNMGMGMFYRNQHELIITGYPRTNHIKLRGKKTYGDIQDSNVWSIKREYQKQHGAQKPVETAERAIRNSSNDGDLVLEFFAGSGTTMVASHQLKRKCYGMELDPKYCQVIIDRMKQLDPSLIIKKNGVVVESLSV